jgi:hypothetical protein
MIDLADIAPAFSFVVGKGFAPSLSGYSPLQFGDAVLVMEGALFSIRFVRDRGQVFVDAGSNVVGWHKLEYVLEFVDKSVNQHQLGEPPDLVVMANLLRSNWDRVQSLFSDQKQSAQLQVFAKEKSEVLLSGFFQKPLG